MKKRYQIAIGTALVGALCLLPALARSAGGAKSTTVVWQVTGIHCPPCVQAIEGTLKKVAGVSKLRSVVKDRLVEVAYDSGRVDVQQLARAIAGTPSPMGGKFAPALLLKVTGIRTEQDARRLQASLAAAAGVAGARVSAGSPLAAVSFADGASARLDGLVAAAKKAGYAVAPASLSEAGSAKTAGASPASTGAHGCSCCE